MSASADGGPAFPILGINRDLGNNLSKFELAPHGGMTLRDYFAAKALQGLLAGTIPTSDSDGCFGDPNTEEVEDGMQKQYLFGAQLAYGYADAMINERQK